MASTYARDEIEAGRPLLLHCHHGKDRSGRFMAHYLTQRRELPTLDAIAAVKVVRPVGVSADGWDRFAVEVVDACAGLIRQVKMSKGGTQN